MAIEVIRGPFMTPPAWSPSTVTFVRNNISMRELSEPRVAGGSFTEQAAAWMTEKAFGGQPQYWQVDTTAQRHPEVSFQLLGAGGLKFDVCVSFDVRVVDARRALEQNIRDLQGYFNGSLHHELSHMAGRYDMTQSADFQQQAVTYYGNGNTLTNGVVAAVNMVVQVLPDAAAKADIQKIGLLSTRISAMKTDMIYKQAEIDAFTRMTGGLSLEALTALAIATNDPAMWDRVHKLKALKQEQRQQSIETLGYLKNNGLLEAMDIQRIGALDDDAIATLVRDALGLAPNVTKRLPKA